MEDLSENENTVAVLTIYYKEKQLTNLVFKRREMADKFVDTLQQLLNEEGKKGSSQIPESKHPHAARMERYGRYPLHSDKRQNNLPSKRYRKAFTDLL